MSVYFNHLGVWKMRNMMTVTIKITCKNIICTKRRRTKEKTKKNKRKKRKKEKEEKKRKKKKDDREVALFPLLACSAAP